MIITISYNELVNDLIENVVFNWDEPDYMSMVMDVLRFGCEGYLNKSNQSLINEALKKKIYGTEVKSIRIK